MSPFFTRALDYARAVASGETVACKWARFACERFLRDLDAEEKEESWPFFIDKTEKGDAHRVCRFAEMLPHVKSDWAKKREDGKINLLKLEPWQCFILVNIFGWKKKADGMRRFVEATVFVPRKNGKSMLAAVIGWWMFAKDKEPGAEVYSGATKEKQAMEVFQPARRMQFRVPALREQLGVTVRAKSMLLDDGSRFEPIVGIPTDGSSPHCAIIDEYHEHKTSGLRDSMRTGMGARKQPLLFTISTAGYNIEGPCHLLWQDVEKLLSGLFEDENHFAIIYCSDDPENWADPVEIRKANPNLGASLYFEKIARDIENAKRNPLEQTTAKTKTLNLWVRSKVSLFNVDIWKKNVRQGMKPSDFSGQSFYGGLDLAFRSDLTSYSQVFPEDGKFYAFGHHFHHMEFVSEPENKHFAKWAKDGWLYVNDGNTIDLERVYDKIRESGALGSLEALVYDEAHSQAIVQPLISDGVNCVKMDAEQQKTGRVLEWIVDFDAAYRRGEVIHDGNALTEWSIGNCVGKPARGGMVALQKPNPRAKIDPVVSLIFAFGWAKANISKGAPGIAFI